MTTEVTEDLALGGMDETSEAHLDPEPSSTDAGLSVEEAAAMDESHADLAFETKKFMLQALLEKAASVLPSRDVMAVLKNFQLSVEPGKLTVVATDLELSVVCSSQMVKVQRPGIAVFPGKKLLDIVKEAEDGQLVLDVKDGTATITVGKTTWDIKLMDGSEYPELPETEDVEFHPVDRAKFLGALSAVRYAAATETVRPSLMMIDITDGKVRAADGVRLQQATLGDKFPIDIQIPIMAVDDIVKLLRTTEAPKIEVGDDENFIVFRVAGDVFICNKLNAAFPDVDDQILKPALANDQELHVDRQELLSAIKRVRINADPETSAVVLALSEDMLIVQAKDKFGNTAVEPISVKWDSGSREVAFNHTHLAEMLQMADVKSCHFKLGADGKTRKSPILFQDEATGQIGVLNQIRLDFVS